MRRREGDTVSVNRAYRQVQGNEERTYEEAVVSNSQVSQGAATKGIISE